MKKLTPGKFSVFLNPVFTIQIHPSLEVVAETQVICFKGKDGWGYDDINLMDITEIRYNGFVINNYQKIRSFTDHHKTIGMDIWEVVYEEATKIIKEYTAETFIEAFSDLQLTK